MAAHEEFRRVTNKELSDLALAAAKEASTETAAKFWAVFGINIADEKQAADARDLFIFMFGLLRTYRDTRHRFWVVFVTIVSGAVIYAAGQAIVTFVRAKFH